MLNTESKLCPFKKMQINCGASALALSEPSTVEGDSLSTAKNALVTRIRFEKCDGKDCMAFDEVNDRCNLIPKPEVYTKSFLKEEVATLGDVRERVYHNNCIQKEILNTLLRFSSFETAKRLIEQMESECPQRILDSDSDIKLTCAIYKSETDTDNYFIRIEAFMHMASKVADESVICIVSNNFNSIELLQVEPIMNEWILMQN